MAALTKERDTKDRLGDERAVPVKANVKIFAGAGVVASGGYAAPASTALNLTTLGRAEETVDNTGGAAGAKTVRVMRGVFKYANSAAADLIAADDVEADCYWVDDQTVALTNGGGTRSRAGKIFAVDADGEVWVDTRR